MAVNSPAWSKQSFSGTVPIPSALARGIRTSWCANRSHDLSGPQHRDNVGYASAGRRASILSWGTPEFSCSALPSTDACVAETMGHSMDLPQEMTVLRELLGKLRSASDYVEKVTILEHHPRVFSFLRNDRSGLLECLERLTAAERYVVLCLLAMGQSHVLRFKGGVELQKLFSLSEALVRVDSFYNSLGGLVGYQLKCQQLIMNANDRSAAELPGLCENKEDGNVICEKFHVPAGFSLCDGHAAAANGATSNGLSALPVMAEIYPLGGAGDRLGLVCESSGDCLPTAVLPYCGRTLLEGLIRDLQAREYLYYRVHGEQCTTPVAIMTSDAKGNHRRVLRLLETSGWFGRGRSSYRLFRQPLVPVVCCEDGSWLVAHEGVPMMKPGGHGAIWKLMLDEGVFDWLLQNGREAALVRQISNPMAGQDNMLLALAGAGYFDGKAFGFASCERTVGAAEGVNVLRYRRMKVAGEDRVEHEYGVTNVEYTEFERLGVSDEAHGDTKLSRYPANTNVLYLGLQAAKAAVEAGVRAGGGAALPGMILNTKKQVVYRDAHSGEERQVAAGRLECTMQNLADSFAQRFRDELPVERHGDLSTFVVFNTRRKVTSSAKRKRKPGSLKVAQTPDGSFLDLSRNARELLLQCDMDVPEVGSVEEYLERGPGFIFLFHPALGPLWSVIAQKLRGGRLAAGGELVLEVAEAQLVDNDIEGSLLVVADSVMGHKEGSGAHCSQAHHITMLPHGSFDAVYAENGHRYNGRPHPAQPVPHDARLVYSSACGRVRLLRCCVRNRGVDWACTSNVYWKHQVARHEACRIVLEGRSEFEAEGVVFDGDCVFHVPSGYRMVVRNGQDGSLVPELIPLGGRPSWEWKYQQCNDGCIQLHLESAPWWAPGQTTTLPALLGGEDMAILI